MTWRYKIMGGHTHVRVFMNGWKCGDLCFRNEDFVEIKNEHEWLSGGEAEAPFITFIAESPSL